MKKWWEWFNAWIATNTFSENAAHVLAAYCVLLTAAHYGGTPWKWAIGELTIAAGKEYGYDAYFEIPHQTFAMNSVDFFGYCVGTAFGLAVLYV
jgi:hypothetical protein